MLRRQLEVGVRLDALQHAVGRDVLDDRKLVGVTGSHHAMSRPGNRAANSADARVEFLLGERRPEDDSR